MNFECSAFKHTTSIDSNTHLETLSSSHNLFSDNLNDELKILKDLILFHSPSFEQQKFDYRQNDLKENIEPLTTLISLPPLNLGENEVKRNREMKIRRYKEKVKKWREKHPVSRRFEGRRKVATTKYRLNGKFAKSN